MVDNVEATFVSTPSRSTRLLRTVAGLSLAAALLSGYLLFVSASAARRPLGCGAGSGCDEVLTSPWSRVLGIPVGLPAIVLYMCLTGAAMLSARSTQPVERTAVSAIGWIASGAVLSAVGWFVGLQTVELRAFCPWCLAAHALGAAASLLMLCAEVLSRRFRPALFIVGVALTGLLAAVQITWPSRGPPAQSLTSQQIDLLAGQLQFELAAVPHVGESVAAPPVVLLFDYCCPHCRKTHEQLLQIQQAHAGRFNVVLLPVPLNADCNPGVDETEPRFESACELARIALAVWRVAPDRFAEFDRWLFATEQPRTADEARRQAEQLAPPAELDASLADDWITARIKQNVQAFEASEVESIPVLLTPSQGGASGRVESREALEDVLRLQLRITLD